MTGNRVLAQVDKGMKTLNLIWVVLLCILTFYLIFALLFKRNFKPSNENVSTIEFLRWALYLISVATFGVIYFLRKMLMTSKRRLTGWTEPTKAQQNPAIVRYSTAVVFSLAISESIGIYGLALFFMGGEKIDLISLVILSATAMILYRPKREELLEMLKKQLPER
jgi:hypothetical protein